MINQDVVVCTFQIKMGEKNKGLIRLVSKFFFRTKKKFLVYVVKFYIRYKQPYHIDHIKILKGNFKSKSKNSNLICDVPDFKISLKSTKSLGRCQS